MKKIKLFIAFMGVFALIFYACSKDENHVNPDEKATLSFGAIVQDLANKSANKQALEDIPACSDDAPAYVEVIVMQGDQEVVGAEGAPFRIDLVAGQVFTEEVPELQLEPGTYSLDHFAVYNDEGTLIWLAPRVDSELAPFVDSALPLSINLGAGVKKYVEVSVLCYDDREVNQYGYLFFELDATEAVEFCFFANYCPPGEDGRHYTANYSVDIWWGTDNTGTPLYTGVTPVTGMNDAGDYFAEPACFVLPDNDDVNEPYLYYEVTLLDWPDNYGTVAPGTVISGTLTAQDIMDNFDGEDNVNYEHIRFNCAPTGGDCPEGDMDGDGVCDNDDNCPNNANPDQTDTDGDGIGDVCDDTPGGEDPCAGQGGDSDGDGICDDVDNCPNDPNKYQEDTDGDGIGNVCDETPGGGDPCTAGDLDGDGICDDVDNCPDVANPDQDNRDGDEWGDVCDLCPDVATDDNVECPDAPGNMCDTAYMFGDQELNELDYRGNNWGWGLLIDGDSFDNSYYNEAEGIWEFPFYAGAGQNDTSKGWQAGTVEVSIDDDAVTVQIVLNSGVTIDGSHIWFSEDGWPESRAPGQFNYNYNADMSDDLHTYDVEGDGPYYLIVHGGVCN